MNNWKPISDIQRKEIITSKGGKCYSYFVLASWIYGIMSSLLLLLAAGHNIFAMLNPDEYITLTKNDLIPLSMMIAGLFMLWVMLTFLEYGINVVVRFFRIHSKKVTYQYCLLKTDDFDKKLKHNEYKATLEDGTEVIGKLYDDHPRYIYATTRVIAYKIENNEKIYFSIVKHTH